LEQAYNDSLGITARFNLNLLRRINRELGGEFDLDLFVHQATYSEERSRIEMYLVSSCAQDVHITELRRHFHFDKGERIHTENSHKYSLEAIETMAEGAGLKMVNRWLDSKAYFSLALFKTAGGVSIPRDSAPNKANG